MNNFTSSQVILAVFVTVLLVRSSAYEDYSKQPGERLQNALDRMSYQMRNLQVEVSRLSQRFDSMERKQDENKRDITALTVTVGNLKQGYEKLSKVDAVWRNNFRVVNNVLAILKTKFMIISDPIRFLN